MPAAPLAPSTWIQYFVPAVSDTDTQLVGSPLQLSFVASCYRRKLKGGRGSELEHTNLNHGGTK